MATNGSVDLEGALDELYSVPLDEFTATRNALAKQLTGTDAADLKARKKPNTAAWALNRLAREHAEDLEHLFEVTNALRVAQRRVLSGGKASDLRRAGDERGKVVARLAKLGESILRDNGLGAAPATVAAISDTLMAVASSDENAELVRSGRLTRELEPLSVLDVGGLTLVETPEDEAAADTSDLDALAEARDAVSQARGNVKTAKDAYKSANADALDLAKRADEAERNAKAAREAAEFARRAADARRAEFEEAEQALETAQRVLEDLG